MNDLMSGGIHRIWKDAMVEWLNPQPGWKTLDVAGGTGDIAFRIADMARARGGAADITVCDINPDMVGEGVRRATEKGEKAITWTVGDAEHLPVPDSSMDAYTIAFGIRNVTHIDKALTEARRVLKPGGRFLCLEFSRVEVPGLDALYDTYSFKILPKMGAMVAGDEEAYRYLAESIRRFPPQARFASMIEKSGLSRVKVRNLSGGVAAMHSAWKI
jgi:demethylmenaquinone methyltransferase/2-methoxy-6-polyprenyl-1,4-benzoquinol methylase